MKTLIRRCVGTLAALGLSVAASQAYAVPVNVQLALVVDISGSVDQGEYILQRQGYVDAFNSAAIQGAISALPQGAAVAMYFFSTLATANRTDPGDPDYVMWAAPVVPWTLLQTAADSAAFAGAIGAVARPVVDPSDPKGDTNIASGVVAAMDGLANNDFEGRMVIDVSGDGVQNTELNGEQPDTGCNGGFAQFQQVCFDVINGQRDAASAAGIIINALAIETEPTFGLGTLSGYFEDHLITGDGSFALAVADFNSFGDAIAQKIFTEIIPVPAAVYLFVSGLIALGAIGRRKIN